MSTKKISQNTDVENDIIDLDLSVTKKKRFRFDKDNNRILELNVSDMNIIARISDNYPKLTALNDKAMNLMDGINTDEDTATMNDLNTMADRLKEIDAEMRNIVDTMFNANVCEVAAPDGSMYDPFNGSFRFEYIITLLMGQYETNLQSEFRKMDKQLIQHTAKYTKGKR